jgi:hypothetical protein
MTETIVILRPVTDIGLIPGEDEVPGEDVVPDAADFDEQGNPERLDDIEIESSGWAVGPLVAAEDSLATGQQSIRGYTLYLRDEWVDVRPDDRVIVRGDVHAVSSPAAAWEHPLSGRRGTVVVVRRVS